MKLRAILETVIYVDDLAAAEAFYTGVLGLIVYAKVEDRHVFFKLDGQMLLLFDPKATEQPPSADARLPVPPHGSRGAGHVCFRASAAEIDGWRDHLIAKNVAIEAELEWPGGGRSIYFRDPAGNSLELAEAKIWGLT